MSVEEMQLAEKKAEKYVTAARTLMVGGGCQANAGTSFWATLSMRLEPIPAWWVPTCATDGVNIFYNPSFVCEIFKDLACGATIWAHETAHAALKHCSRRGGRLALEWNLAIDCVVNWLLTESGFRFPPGDLHCMPGKGVFRDIPAGLSAEETYELIIKHKIKLPGMGGGKKKSKGGSGSSGSSSGSGSSGSGSGSGSGSSDDGEGRSPDGRACVDPGRMGGAMDTPGGRDGRGKVEADWGAAIAHAAKHAQRRGTLPAGLARLIPTVIPPKIDPWGILEEFVTRTAQNDYNWLKPNRRWIHRGMYLPTLDGEELGRLLVLVDCSGSIDDKMLGLFAGHLEAIIRRYSVRLTIAYHDVPVVHVQEWEPNTGELRLQPHGGGGTSHIPAFKWVAEQLHSPEPPVAVVALTDGKTDFPKHAPDCPTLWAIKGYRDVIPPWGQLVRLGTFADHQ